MGPAFAKMMSNWEKRSKSILKIENIVLKHPVEFTFNLENY